LVVVIVVVVINLHEKPVEEKSERYEYNAKIYNIIYAIPNLHHTNKALTEVPELSLRTLITIIHYQK